MNGRISDCQLSCCRPVVTFGCNFLLGHKICYFAPFATEYCLLFASIWKFVHVIDFVLSGNFVMDHGTKNVSTGGLGWVGVPPSPTHTPFDYLILCNLLVRLTVVICEY